MKTLNQAKAIFKNAFQPRIDLYDKEKDQGFITDQLRYTFYSSNIPGKYGYNMTKQFLTQVENATTIQELVSAGQWYADKAGKEGTILLIQTLEAITGKNFNYSELATVPGFAVGLDFSPILEMSLQRQGFIKAALKDIGDVAAPVVKAVRFS